MTDIVERLRLAAAETDWYLSMQEAADEIERLRNELSDEVMINARLRSERASPEHVALLEGEIAELRSKLEAAEKDTARYRWLATGRRRDRIWHHVLSDVERQAGNFLENVIDAAMEREK